MIRNDNGNKASLRIRNGIRDKNARQSIKLVFLCFVQASLVMVQQITESGAAGNQNQEQNINQQEFQHQELLLMLSFLQIIVVILVTTVYLLKWRLSIFAMFRTNIHIFILLLLLLTISSFELYFSSFYYTHQNYVLQLFISFSLYSFIIKILKKPRQNDQCVTASKLIITTSLIAYLALRIELQEQLNSAVEEVPFSQFRAPYLLGLFWLAYTFLNFIRKRKKKRSRMNDKEDNHADPRLPHSNNASLVSRGAHSPSSSQQQLHVHQDPQEVKQRHSLIKPVAVELHDNPGDINIQRKSQPQQPRRSLQAKQTFIDIDCKTKVIKCQEVVINNDGINMIDVIPMGIMLYDEDLDIIYHNKNMETILKSQRGCENSESSLLFLLEKFFDQDQKRKEQVTSVPIGGGGGVGGSGDGGSGNCVGRAPESDHLDNYSSPSRHRYEKVKEKKFFDLELSAVDVATVDDRQTKCFKYINKRLFELIHQQISIRARMRRNSSAEIHIIPSLSISQTYLPQQQQLFHPRSSTLIPENFQQLISQGPKRGSGNKMASTAGQLLLLQKVKKMQYYVELDGLYYEVQLIPCQCSCESVVTQISKGSKQYENDVHITSKHPCILVSLEEVTDKYYRRQIEEIQSYKLKMLASVSHELRTQLNCAILMLQVAQGRIEREIYNELILPALQSSQIELSIVNDILDFAQIEAGTIQLQIECVNLRQTVQECLDIISLRCQKKGLDLKFKIKSALQLSIFENRNEDDEEEDSAQENHIRRVEDEDDNNSSLNTEKIKRQLSGGDSKGKGDIYINTDKQRLQQLLLNLLMNAIKFTNEGHIKVKLKQLSQKQVTVSVSDTGIGIPAENRKIIFSLFGQTQQNQRFQSFGAGLGLTISNLMAKLLANSVQSEICLTENKNKGSKFSFTVIDLNDCDERELNKHEHHNIQKYTQRLLSQYSKSITSHSGTSQLKRHHKSFQEMDSPPYSCKKSPNQNNKRLSVSNYISSRFDNEEINNEEPNDDPNENRQRLPSQGLSSFLQQHDKESSSRAEMQQAQQKESCNLSIQDDLDQMNHNDQCQYSELKSSTTRYKEYFSNRESYQFQSSDRICSARQMLPNPQPGPNTTNQEGSPHPSTITFNCSCIKILLVDDNEFNLMALSALLQSTFTLKSDSALSGKLALQKIQKKMESNSCCLSYFLILMDLDMPEWNGFQTTQKILEFYKKMNKECPPIVACSAFIGEDSKVAAKAAGMKGFINKPVIASVLQSYLKKCGIIL